MTPRPVSLLVCHWASEFAGGADWKYLDESSDEREFEGPGSSSFMGDGRGSPSSATARRADDPDDGVLLGFAHEGVTSLTPFASLGCFVSCRPWCRASLRSAAAGGGGPPPETLQCSGHGLGRRAAFRWCAGGGLRHAATGHWLHVDPAAPERPALREEAGSLWEALPAL
ncbi:unnamed protein product [Prorocentrum cordatum]|uniref:Uncharacterized protein n=1 Tax=Prorocentrum cordatum TaxID=2364126 RepID=A0ABN9RUG6_9DINO|nr:unnamed protein product [Polarella glacialis]